jgi:hypothetical protein
MERRLMFLDRLFGCQLRYIEYLLASISAWWGIWLLMPWQSFASTPTFAFAHRVAPEWAWGTVVTTGGMLLFTGLLMVSRPIRRAALMLLSLTWLSVWVALTVGNWQSTATIIYVHMAVMCAFAYLRLSYANQQ